MKNARATFIAAIVLSGCGRLPEQVLIRSEESFAIDGGPVFNRIRLYQEDSNDVWMMSQTHEGLTSAQWDRLAIVVDRVHASAKFYQLESGPIEKPSSVPVLDWVESLKQKEFRVSCAICHSNGPRAIRPAPGSLDGAGNWLRISLWNLRIKTYGYLKEEAALFEGTRSRPFRFAGAFANSPLQVAVCVFCHRNNGPVARGTLVRQNALAIEHMVSSGKMPPLGIPLPASQQAEIENFLNGL